MGARPRRVRAAARARDPAADQTDEYLCGYEVEPRNFPAVAKDGATLVQAATTQRSTAGFAAAKQARLAAEYEESQAGPAADALVDANEQR